MPLGNKSSPLLTWWGWSLTIIAVCMTQTPLHVVGQPYCPTGFLPATASHRTVLIDHCQGEVRIGDMTHADAITNATIYIRNVSTLTLLASGAITHTQIFIEDCSGSTFRNGIVHAVVHHTSIHIARSTMPRGIALDGNVTVRDFNFTYVDSVVEAVMINDSPRLLYYGNITLDGSSVLFANLSLNMTAYMKSMSLHSISEGGNVRGMQMVVKNTTIRTATPSAFVFAVLSGTMSASQVYCEDVSVTFDPVPAEVRALLGKVNVFRGMLGANDSTLDDVSFSMQRTIVQAADTIAALSFGTYNNVHILLEHATLGVRSAFPSGFALQQANVDNVTFLLANYTLTMVVETDKLPGAHINIANVHASNLSIACQGFFIVGDGNHSVLLLSIVDSTLVGGGGGNIVLSDGGFENRFNGSNGVLQRGSVLAGCLLHLDNINITAVSGQLAVFVWQSTWAARTHLVLHRVGLSGVDSGMMVRDSTLLGASMLTLSNVTWRLNSCHLAISNSALTGVALNLDAVDLTLDLVNNLGVIFSQHILALYNTTLVETSVDVVATRMHVMCSVVRTNTLGAPAHVGIGNVQLRNASFRWRHCEMTLDLVHTRVTAAGMFSIGELSNWTGGGFELSGCNVNLLSQLFVVMLSFASSDCTGVAFIIHERTRVVIQAANVTQWGGTSFALTAAFLSTSLEAQIRWNMFDNVQFMMRDSTMLLSSEDHPVEMTGTASAFLVINQSNFHSCNVEFHRTEFHGQHSMVLTMPQGAQTQSFTNSTFAIRDNSNVTIIGHGPMLALFVLLSTMMDPTTIVFVDRSNVTLVTLRTPISSGTICALIAIGPADRGFAVKPIYVDVRLSNASKVVAANRNDNTNPSSFNASNGMNIRAYGQVAMVTVFGTKHAGDQNVSSISVAASSGSVVNVLDGDIAGVLLAQGAHLINVSVALSCVNLTLQPKGSDYFVGSLLLLSNGSSLVRGAVYAEHAALDIRIQFVNASSTGPLPAASVALALYFAEASSTNALVFRLLRGARVTLHHTAVVFPRTDAGTALLALVGLNGGAVLNTTVTLESGAALHMECVECMAIAFAQSNVRSDLDCVSLSLSNATMFLSANRENSSTPVLDFTTILDQPSKILNAAGITYQGLGVTRRLTVDLDCGSQLTMSADLAFILVVASSLVETVTIVHLGGSSRINATTPGSVLLFGALRAASFTNSSLTVAGGSSIDVVVSGPFAATSALAVINSANVKGMVFNISGASNISLLLLKVSHDGTPIPLPTRDQDTALASAFFFDTSLISRVSMTLDASSTFSIQAADAAVAFIISKIAVISDLSVVVSNRSRFTVVGNTTGSGINFLNLDGDGADMLTKVVGLASLIFCTKSAFLSVTIVLESGGVAVLSSPMATAFLMHQSILQGTAVLHVSSGSLMRLEATTNTSTLACVLLLATNCTLASFQLLLDGANSNKSRGGAAAALEMVIAPINLTAQNFGVGFVLTNTKMQRVDVLATNGASITINGGASMVALLMAQDSTLMSAFIGLNSNASLLCTSTAAVRSNEGGGGGDVFSDNGFSASGTSGLVATMVAIRSTIAHSRIVFEGNANVTFSSPLVTFMTLQSAVVQDTDIRLTGGAVVHLTSTARNSTALLACFLLVLSAALDNMVLDVATGAHLVVEVRPQPLEINDTAMPSGYTYTRPSTSYFTVGIMAKDSNLSFVELRLRDGGRVTTTSSEGTAIWLLTQHCNASSFALNVSSHARMEMRTMFSGRGVNLFNGLNGLSVNTIGGLCSLHTSENSTVKNSSIAVATQGVVMLACPLATAALFSKSHIANYRIAIAANGTLNITAHNNSMSLMSTVVLAFSSTMVGAVVDIDGGGRLLVAIIVPTTSTTSNLMYGGSYFSAGLMFVEATLDGLSITLTNGAMLGMVGFDAMVAVIIAQNSTLSSVSMRLNASSELNLYSTSTTTPLDISGLQSISISSLSGMAAFVFSADGRSLDGVLLAVHGASRVVINAPVATVVFLACSASVTACAVDHVRLVVVDLGSRMQLNTTSAGAFLLASNISLTNVSAAVRDGGDILIAGHTGSVATFVVVLGANITNLAVWIAERASLRVHGLARGTTCTFMFTIGVCHFAGTYVGVSSHASLELLAVPLSNVSVVPLTATTNGLSDALTGLLGAAAVLLLVSEGSAASNTTILVDLHSHLLIRGAISTVVTCQKCALNGFRLLGASGAALQLPTLGISIALMIAEPLLTTNGIEVSFKDAAVSQMLPLSAGNMNNLLVFLFISIAQTLHTMESLSISLVHANLTITCLRCQMALAVFSGPSLVVSNASVYVTEASNVILTCTQPLLTAPLMQLIPLLSGGGDVSALIGPEYPDKAVGGLVLIVAGTHVEGLDVVVSGEGTLVSMDVAMGAAILAIQGSLVRSQFAVRDHGSVVIQGGRGYGLTFTSVSTGGIVAFLLCMKNVVVDQVAVDVNRGTVTTRLEQGISASLLLLSESVLGSSSGGSSGQRHALRLSLANQSVVTAMQMDVISVFGSSVPSNLYLMRVFACSTSAVLPIQLGVYVNVSANSTVAMYIPTGSEGMVGHVYVWNTPRIDVSVHIDATSALELPAAATTGATLTPSGLQFVVKVSATTSVRISTHLYGRMAMLPSTAAVWVSSCGVEPGSAFDIKLLLPTVGAQIGWSGEILRFDGATSVSNTTVALGNMTILSTNAKLMSSPAASVQLSNVSISITDCILVGGGATGSSIIDIGTLTHCVVTLTRNAFHYASLTSSTVQGLSDPRGPIRLLGRAGNRSSSSNEVLPPGVTLLLDDNAFHRFATIIDAASLLLHPDAIASHCTTFLRQRAWVKSTMTPGPSRAVVLPIMQQYNTAVWSGAVCEWSRSVTASDTVSAVTPTAANTMSQSKSVTRTLTLTRSVGSASSTRSRRPTPSMATVTGTEEKTTTETIIPPTPTISLYIAQRPCPQITAVLATPSQITDAMFTSSRLAINLTLPSGYRWWNRPWSYNAETFFRFEVIVDTQPQPQGFDRYMKESALLNRTEWRFSGSHTYDTITVTLPLASQYRLLLSEDVAISFDPRAIQFQCVGDIKARAVFRVSPAQSTALVDAATYSAAGAALAALSSIGVSSADNQLLLILAGTKCSTAVLGGTTGMSMYLLSPFFDYGFEAMIYGNIGIVLAVALLQNVLAAVFYCIVLRSKVGQPAERTNALGELEADTDPNSRRTTSTDYVFVAWSQVQFPGLTYAVAILLQQGTFLAAMRITFRGEGGQNAAVAVVLAVVYTFAMIRAFLRFLDTPKRLLESGELIPMENRNATPVFKTYDEFKSIPLGWRLLNPIGRWGPREQVRMFGKYFGQMQPAYFHLGPYPSILVVVSTLFAIIPFSGTGCIVQFVLLGLVPIVAGVFVLYRRPHRIPMVSVIGGTLHLIAGVIAMVTAYMSSESASNSTDFTIQLVQLGLTTVSSCLVVARTLVTSRVFYCENFLWRNVAIKISTIASTALNALFGDMGGNIQSKKTVAAAPKQTNATLRRWQVDDVSSTSDDDDELNRQNRPQRTAFEIHEAMAKTNRTMLPLQINVNAIALLGTPWSAHDRLARLNQLLKLAALEKSYKGLLVELKGTGAWMPANLVDGADLI